MSLTALPEGYMKRCALDLDNDKKQSVRVNMLGLMLMIPFAVVLLIIFVNTGDKTVSFDMNVANWLVFFAAIALALVVHELVHGLFFRLFSVTGKVKFGFNVMFAYAGNPDVYYNKTAFMIIALAPSVIVNLAIAASLIFLRGTPFYIAYMTLAIHFAGCVGDFMAAGMLAKLPPDALAMDTGLVMTFYSR